MKCYSSNNLANRLKMLSAKSLAFTRNDLASLMRFVSGAALNWVMGIWEDYDEDNREGPDLDFNTPPGQFTIFRRNLRPARGFNE